MATTIFDTLSFSRKLTDAGMDQRQADALAGPCTMRLPDRS